MRWIKLVVVALFLLPLVCLIGQRFSVTTHAQSTVLAAPTGVIASDGSYSNKVGLNWEAIRGATLYRIFRNTTNDTATATSIGTTAAGDFFDTTAVVNQTYFYWVRAENGSTVSDFSAPDQGVRASGTIGPLPPLNPPPAPIGNPITATKAYLGKALFWDEQLSSTRTVACGTCHHAGNGGADPRSLVGNPLTTNAGADNVFGTADDVYASPGVPLNFSDGTYDWSLLYGLKAQVTGRKSLSYINAGYSPLLFWDGRATGTFRDPITNAIVLNNGAALESQVLGPPVSSAEMAHVGRDWNNVAARIAESRPLALASNVPGGLQTWIGGRSYAELFTEAFGTPEVTPARIALAIATFERTLYGDRTPFDADLANIAQLTPAETRGQNIFNGVGRCNLCHAGNLFSDNQFHNIGLRPQTEDTGRFQVTGNNANLGEFRTPSLRNVELRTPYMHNGHFATLEEVVDFYNRGGDFDAPNIDHNRIRPLGLTTQQKADLVAFLRRPLTDPRVAAATAPFDRPTLYTETTRVPQIIGSGVAGSGGAVPQVVAIEPPLLGNPSFTVATYGALGNSPAVLVINDSDPGTGPAIPATGSFARRSLQLSGNGAGNGYGSISLAIPNNAALSGRTFFGRWYISDANAPGGVAVTQAFRFTVFGEATTTINRAVHADFDGDGKTDISIFRSSAGAWYLLRSSSNSLSAQAFGLSSDKLAPADYDGDGKADIAVFRDGSWYLLRSQTGFTALSFGSPGDVPQPGDYDGDGIADLAVWRPSDGAWYIQRSRDGFTAVQFGLSGDRPVAADYDGDGKVDPAVYRNGVWYLLRSSAGFAGVQFGTTEDKPVVGDYDGDGKSDIAVWRPSNGSWYYQRSSDNGFRSIAFGLSGDQPSPGDYDGDGQYDLAVFRPSEGNWYILQSTNNTVRGQGWGLSEDLSVPAAFVP